MKNIEQGRSEVIFINNKGIKCRHRMQINQQGYISHMSTHSNSPLKKGLKEIVDKVDIGCTISKAMSEWNEDKEDGG